MHELVLLWHWVVVGVTEAGQLAGVVLGVEADHHNLVGHLRIPAAGVVGRSQVGVGLDHTAVAGVAGRMKSNQEHHRMEHLRGERPHKEHLQGEGPHKEHLQGERHQTQLVEEHLLEYERW